MFEEKTISIADTETDGLLNDLSVIHVLVVRKMIKGILQPSRTFRCNSREDTIAEGLAYMADADIVVGQNFLGYDLLAIEKVFPDFYLDAVVRDTEVLARQVFPDQKERDFELWRRGQLPGQHIGAQTLEAWGHRLGLNKGDYKKEREAQAKTLGITDPKAVTAYVWGEWNQDLEDYCVQDVEVTVALWLKIVDELVRRQWSMDAIVMRHRAHELMVRQQNSGFGFDAPLAFELAKTLKGELDALVAEAKRFYGSYYHPATIYKIGNFKKQGQVIEQRPRAEYGEDGSRDSWAQVTMPVKPSKDGRTPGHPFCMIIQKEFKPTSRQQIVNRLKTIHNWVPTDFTETGGVSVSDDILRPLAEQWPICATLADIFFYQKMLGAIAGSDLERVEEHLASGALPTAEDDREVLDFNDSDDEDEPNESAPAGDLFGAPAADAPVKKKARPKKSSAWLLHYNPATGCIHHRCVIGATVSTRAAHSNPNLGQVKSVSGAKDTDDEAITAQSTAWVRKTGTEWKLDSRRVRIGRLGSYGYECRGLFKPRPGFNWQTGIDLTGIEMRALGARLKPYDDGEFLAEVMTPGMDPHKKNVVAFGLAGPNATPAALDAAKPLAKKTFYAMIYGSGDSALGAGVMSPGTSEAALAARGKELKENFFKGRPAFKRLIMAIERECQGGFILGLDGSRLYARKKHALLNLRLQSDGAIIATKWTLLIDERLADQGLVWGQDYSQLAYVHDENQFGSVTDEHAFLIGDVAIQAAWDAGEFFGYAAPVAAEAKVGRNWADCH